LCGAPKTLGFRHPYEHTHGMNLIHRLLPLSVQISVEPYCASTAHTAFFDQCQKAY
jgi:hypothetical protein